jgi:hypothetical protein
VTPSSLSLELCLEERDLGAGLEFWRSAGGAHLLSEPAVPSAWTELRLGLVVDDLARAVDHAVRAGARRSRDAPPGTARLRSPSGLALVLRTSLPEHEVAPLLDWGGHRSRIDQLCLDVEHSAWHRELDFWSALTGWGVDAGRVPGFARLAVPRRHPVRVLLQRRERGPTSAHVDVASSDRVAEVARLRSLGAAVVHEGPRWTTLAPPVGPAVCVTDRDPETGLLPPSPDTAHS